MNPESARQQLEDTRTAATRETQLDHDGRVIVGPALEAYTAAYIAHEDAKIYHALMREMFGQ